MKCRISLHGINKTAISLFLVVVLIAGMHALVESGENQKKSQDQGDKGATANPLSFMSHMALAALISNSIEKEVKTGPEKGPRIPPLPMSEMPEEWIKTLERLPGAGLKGAYTPVNVFGTLMHSPQTMGSFLDYWVTSKLEMGLSGREQELIILRMGFLYDCNYVWKHHVPVAKEFGASDAEIEAIKTSLSPSVFSEREYALLMLTDEMVEHRTIREEAWSKWGAELKPSEVVDLISLVSQYVFFSLLNNGIQIEVEEPLQKIPGL